MQKGDEPMKRYEDFVNGIKEEVEVPVCVQARIEETLSNLPRKEANRKKGRKREEKRSWMSTVAAAMLIIIVLSGCAAAGVHLSKTRVHVIISGSQDTGDALHAEVVDFAVKYEEKHPDIDIVTTLLLNDNTERSEAEMKKMRTEIMAGKGPDLFVLQGVSPDEQEMTYLFPNVNKTMQNGVFACLDKYMEKDQRWETTEVMEKALEAGTYHDKQYVMPLEIEFPMFMQEKNSAIDYSKAKNLKECAEIVKNSNDIKAVDDFMQLQYDIKGTLLEPAVDYEKNQILMEKQSFVDYVTYVQNSFYNAPFLGEMQDVSSGMPSKLFYFADEWKNGSRKKTDVDFQSVPGINGQKIAHVASYGAVSMNSTKKEIAYDFLTSFMNRDIGENSYLFNFPTNIKQLKEYLQREEIDVEAVLNCYNSLDHVVFLSEGSLLTEEKLCYYLQRNSPKPGPELEEEISKMYDEIYQTYETILKE